MIRRRFITASAATTVAAWFPVVTRAAAGIASPTPGVAPPATLRRRLQNLVGARVVIEGPQGRHPATLAELEDGPSSPGVEQFAVRLELTSGPRPGEGVYRLVHTALDPLELHLQPAGARGLRATFALLEAS
ncbi:MAG: hypothetical protein H6983_20390 [Ectothiorhodospiraceae bacterium]|nr:hypothetical protein [Chromatiales bacterium]MCP5156546.1 hypothetical protein [Ectothiorhodospiraceae bacterium]